MRLLKNAKQNLQNSPIYRIIMKVLIAPDSFKESLSAPQVAHIIATVLQKHGIESKQLPVADGGEGTTASLVQSLNGILHTIPVHGPLGHITHASYGMVQHVNTTTAIIEMAQSSGLMLVPPNARNPMHANTYGLGEMIQHALHNGAERIIMGIGGSATNDGGTGMLRALGVRFLNKNGTEISDLPQRLSDIFTINTEGIDSRIHTTPIEVACDVNNPLLGNNGATAIYGPQKGVTDATHLVLESGLQNFADVSERHFNATFRHIQGTGAAGGLGFALIAFLGAHLTSGIDLILKTVDFDSCVQWADIVITGEGKIDHQTLNGKTPAGVASHAHTYGKPTVIIAGAVTDGWQSLMDIGVKNAYAITPDHMDLATALASANVNLTHTTEKIIPDLYMYGT